MVNNQDLLLAILAVLTGTVSRDDLRSSLADWGNRPEKSLKELLKERCEEGEARLNALETLACSQLDHQNGDLRACLDACNALALTEQILTEIDPANTAVRDQLTIGLPGRRTIASEAKTELVSDRQAQPSFIAGQPAEQAHRANDQRYERLKLHAKGGIGQVWLARDRELQREVAVKEIQPKYIDRLDQRGRFLLEAEITGKLEHPGIVPVYSLGQDEQGRLYYAMRFVRGESFSAAIKQFHKQNKDALSEGSSAGWGIEFQQLLRRFLDVCDAMEYAHSRGVLHRDLKPGNIMLGQYGETLVVDWGLAKLLGRSDQPSHETEADDFAAAGPGSLPPGSTLSAPSVTQPGTTVGTPSYMSPEQARCDQVGLCPASDVYSLGATLYELLTGQYPFAGHDSRTILKLVLAGKLPPPRSINPAIPAPLEAICLKAMAFEPADRYQSARELALELQHWIADEPVTAYPEGWPQRLSRWLRRHRSWTYAAAASLAGVALIATLAVFIIDGARRREGEARKEAEANFALAESAVERYLTHVSENTLLKEQDTLDMRRLRQELLESALPFYQSFVKDRHDDPRLREQLARAYFRLGEITRVIGTSDDALGYYQSSRQIWESLVSESPNDPEIQGRLADCYTAIGRLIVSNRPEQAMDWFKRSLTIDEALMRQKPSDPRYQAAVADCHMDLALCLSDLDQVEQGLEQLKLSRAIDERLVSSYPNNIDYKQSLAVVLNRVGYAEYKRLDYAAALKAFQDFQVICQQILDSVPYGPKPLRIQELLARSHYNIGTMYLEQGKNPEALEAFQQAEQGWSKLVHAHPSVTSFQVELGQNYVSMAIVGHYLQREQETLDAVAKGAATFDHLIKEAPDDPTYALEYGRLMTIKGVVHDQSRRNDLAHEPFRLAVDYRQKLHDKDPANLDRKDDLCVSLANLGENDTDRGIVSEGLSLYRKALLLRHELCDAMPANIQYVNDLVELSITLGDIERQLGDSQAARSTYARAAEAISRAIELNPGESLLPALLVRAMDHEGRAHADLHESDDAINDLRTAVEKGRAELKSPAVDEACRGYLTESLWDLGRSLREKGQTADAANLDEERADLWRNRPVDELLALASREAASANIIGYGKTTLEPAGRAVHEVELERAVETLRQALAQDPMAIDKVKSDLNLAPLLEQATGDADGGSVNAPNRSIGQASSSS